MTQSFRSRPCPRTLAAIALMVAAAACAGSTEPGRSQRLRAERSGVGPGRTYTIDAIASDHSGDSARASAEVRVPHDEGN